jgi:uncharacterized protein
MAASCRGLRRPASSAAVCPGRTRRTSSCLFETLDLHLPVRRVLPDGDLMDRRSFLKYANLAGVIATSPRHFFAAEQKPAAPTVAETSAETLLLKDYRPISIYKIPVTHVARARYPIIDMHSHPYAKTDAEIATWLKNMDATNVEKTLILTMSTGNAFDEIHGKYSKYPERFELWCGLDFSEYQQPSFPDGAVKELQRCGDAGARESGKFTTKDRAALRKIQRSGHASRCSAHGRGLGKGGRTANADQPSRGRPDLDVSTHGRAQRRPDERRRVASRQSARHRQASRHDRHSRAHTLARHRGTTFVACHFANLDYDLAHLGEVLDRHPNLYADIAAR